MVSASNPMRWLEMLSKHDPFWKDFGHLTATQIREMSQDIWQDDQEEIGDCIDPEEVA